MPRIDLPLPVLDKQPLRPAFAHGPHDLSSVKLLRLSVTDRCNFRCVYCMPETGVRFYDKKDLLSSDDIVSVAAAARHAGIDHFKLTGGEPTVRPDLVAIVSRLKQLNPRDLSLTTNGLRMVEWAKPLRQAGLDRVTVSLDTLDADRFAAITGGRGQLQGVLDGLDALREAGFERLKLNVVVIGGFNDDEVPALAALTQTRPWTVRFIEYMPLGDSQLLMDGLAAGQARTVDSAVLLETLTGCFGQLSPLGGTAQASDEPGVGPAQLWQLPGAKGRLGFISAMSQPFCETCNRLRLTAKGELRACLFDGGEVDVRPILGNPVLTTEEKRAALVAAFGQCVSQKPMTHSAHGNRQMSQMGG